MALNEIKTNTRYQQCAVSCKSPEARTNYEVKECRAEDDVTGTIIEIFEQNRSAYGTCKIKVELNKCGFTISRRRIGCIMKEQGLVRVKNKWHYVCIFVDLFNREIIGFSTGPSKDAGLVARAFSTIQGDHRDIQLFHTDRGSEFKNQLIDETLAAFQIARSLSIKGCPYDNAVAEATFKTIKTEFVRQLKFDNLEHLTLEFSNYVNWFNKLRINGKLDYVSPIEYKQSSLKKLSDLVLTIHQQNKLVILLKKESFF